MVTNLDTAAIDDDMFAPDVIADPYTYYGRLRELDPVHWNELHQVWVVTRYDDITWLNRHPEIFSSSVPQKDPRPPYPPIDETDRDQYEFVKWHQTGRIITNDRPRHREMRGVLHDWFTPASVEAWRPIIRSAIDALLVPVLERGGMDVIHDFALPLPLMVIAEMLGIPEDERGHVYEIAEKLLVGPRVAPGRMREIADAMRAMDRYATPLVEERSRRPGHDLISVLAGGEQQGVYTRDQVLQNIAFLVVAGHETTINLICNGLLAFIRHPDQWDRLRGDPERLAGPATEECLRYDPPVKSIERIAVSDVELRGKTIKALDRVRWFIASANRDPDRFPHPDSFDIGRSPNPHVGFGHGIHLCLGATVARVEGQEVFRALAERFERFTLETDPLRWAPAAHLRSLKALEVSW
jgi:cytochrome P450